MRIRKRPQRPQIHYVLGKVFSFWCFQHFRNFTETAITHDETESAQTNAPFADVFVPVYSGTARSFGVIKVNGSETIPADHATKLAKCFPDRRFGADVKTGGKTHGRGPRRRKDLMHSLGYVGGEQNSL